MSKSIPPLPKLPAIGPEAVKGPMKFIFGNDNGEIFATRNFSDPYPLWRKYKRLGWAKRYVLKESVKDE